MKFQYFAGEQRTPEWFKIRLGKPTASKMHAWLAVSKSEKTKGKPLKARLDYEKELMFERKFGTSFETFVTEAMQDGIDYEDFARDEYARITGNEVSEVGCWYNEFFVASPDGSVKEPGNEDEGLLEIKIVKDNTFAEILTDGIPDKWAKQIQSQMWASSRKWTDFVAVNLNTKKIKIIRVMADKEEHEWYELAVTEDFNLDETIFDDSGLYDIKSEEPVSPFNKEQPKTDLRGF